MLFFNMHLNTAEHCAFPAAQSNLCHLCCSDSWANKCRHALAVLCPAVGLTSKGDAGNKLLSLLSPSCPLILHLLAFVAVELSEDIRQ